MTSLWDSIGRSSAGLGADAGAEFHGLDTALQLKDLAAASTLADSLEVLRGRSVLLATRQQLPTAVALVELDGVARRMVLCTPDLTAEQLADIALTAEVDAVVSDGALAQEFAPALSRFVLSPVPVVNSLARRQSEVTEWILLTSGTTGGAKLVLHTLDSLAGSLPRQAGAPGSVWSTFYDIRRYGGLQIYLRAMMSGSALVLSSAGEATDAYLARAAAAGVTHISGTPSHWRRALMSGSAAVLRPKYVRLSGEVADQPLLDQLQQTYPGARIAHAFASTEGGVAFDVNDGLAGFPVEFIDGSRNGIDMKVDDGTLRIRSGRVATRYLGQLPAMLGGDGFVDTGDLVERHQDRYYFRGRRGGIINVGGLKVYPEEVEAVLNADPRVRMSLVRARRNPITGAVVVAEVVLADAACAATVAAADAADAAERIKNDLLSACRKKLAAHKVPAVLRFVPALELSAAGKLVRPSA